MKTPLYMVVKSRVMSNHQVLTEVAMVNDVSKILDRAMRHAGEGEEPADIGIRSSSINHERGVEDAEPSLFDAYIIIDEENDDPKNDEECVGVNTHVFRVV